MLEQEGLIIPANGDGDTWARCSGGDGDEKVLFWRGWGHRGVALEVMGTCGCYSGSDRDVWDIGPEVMGTQSCCFRGNRDAAVLVWRW